MATRKKLEIEYSEYNKINDLLPPDKLLLERAIEATNGSYAPYSHFNVGAAVLLENGEIISAANQENAAYPSGLCAERSTIFYAHSKFPNVPIKAIAIAAKEGGILTEFPVYPCGACRQVMHETQFRAKTPIKVIMGGASKIEVVESVLDLIPFAFDNLHGNI